MGQYISGKNSVMAAIEAKMPIKMIYLRQKSNFNIPPNIRITYLSKEELDKISDTNHQGFIALVDGFKYHSLEELLNDKPQKVLIIDHVQDPHNLGSILRSANAFGVIHIIIARNRSAQVNETVLKVASGGQIGLKIVRVSSLNGIVQTLHKNNFWIYATALENSQDINKVPLQYPLALIVGNEGKGVASSLLKSADEVVKIKLSGTVQSLNVSAATAVFLSKI